MNTGEEKKEQRSEKPYSEQTPEEQRITFHRLMKRAADVFTDFGKRNRAERTSQGLPNTRPLEEFEQKTMEATLALGGNGELAGIVARVNEHAEKPAGDTSVFFTLSRLEGEGFITWKRIPESETEGAKVLFTVTEDGARVLADQKANS